MVRKIGGQRVVQGRHATIGGFENDCRKYAAAAVLGWRVLRFNQSLVKSGEAIDWTRRMLEVTDRG